MAPIRVGIIGLSTTSDATNWAVEAHLPYLQSSDKYQIVALCNSSVDKAKASIEKFKLSSSTKAYGSPSDMAQDADVDLAVCVVGVARHYEVLKPMLEAGKDIYTELPLAQTIDQVRELESLAQQKGVRTLFGMQGQANPVILTLKRIIDEGKIGKVLSSTVTAYAEQFAGGPTPKGLATIHDRKIGADFMTVWFLHSKSTERSHHHLADLDLAFNFVLHTLGELSSFDSMLGLVHPKVTVNDPKNPEKGAMEIITATSPDQVFLQGRLQSEALLTYHLEGGKPFPGQPALQWHIVGDKGELFVTNPVALMDIMHGGVKVLLKEGGSKVASEVELPADAAVDNLKHPAQNVGRLYEAFANRETELYADWKLARVRHELINEIYERSDGEQAFGAKAKYLDYP